MKTKLLGISFLLFVAMTPLMESKASYVEAYEEAKVELLNNVDRYEQHSLMIEGLSESKIASIADKFSSSYHMDYLGISGTIDLSSSDNILEIYKAFPMYIENFIPLEKASVTGRTTLDPKDEPRFGSQTYFNTINMGDTWSKTKGDKITVAVIDTGIYYNHQDFYDENGNTIISPKSINISERKVVEDNGNDYSLILDGSFHGTSVASFIAAQVNGLGMTGVAPDVELLIIKANTESDGMTFENAYHLINGISYAVANGADIINMSFGSYGSNIYASQIDAAIAKGITLIAAAGNEETTDSSYPVSDPDVIGAGALASNSLERADFSNYGKNNLTVMAPGESVFAAYTTSPESYAWVGGTSFSSPIVAGVAALYKSLYPSTSPSEMLNLFAASATDLGTAGFDEDFGYGVIDVETLIDGEKGTITYNYLDSEVSNVTRKFIRGHTLQMEPDTRSNGKDIEGWYYDQEFTLPYKASSDILNEDVEIYAKYVSTEVIPVEGISLNNYSLTMSVGETATLVASISPENATNKELIWSSSDDSIASVDQNGLVSAISEGEATISVSDASLSISAAASISVTSADIPTPDVEKGYVGSFKNSTASSSYERKDGFTLTGATSDLAWSSGVAQCASSIFYQGHNSASNAAEGNTSYTDTFGSKLDSILTLSGTYKNYLKMDSSIANASGIRIAYSKADSSDCSGYIIYSIDGGSSWLVGNSFASVSTGGGEFSFNFVSASSNSLGSNVMFALVYSTSATEQRIQLTDVEIQVGRALDGAVTNVINLINAIGEINETNYSSKNASITEAKNAYNALLANQKSQVTNYDLLVSSINQYDAYDFISFYRDYRINGDICWLIGDVEEYEFLIGMYDLLEEESRTIIDNAQDIEGVTIGQTIAYLKSLHAHQASEVPTLNTMPTESVSSYSTILVVVILALLTTTYIVIKKQKE